MNSDRKFLATQTRLVIPAQSAPALISAIAAIFLYAVTLGGTYVYDDLAIVRDDPRVHQISLWKDLWTKDYFDGGVDNLYRPIVSSSYAIEWFLHGDRPWLFHLINILLHALASALVAEFTRRLLGNWPRALIAATCAGLLFAVHPVHVEAVANIVGRAELACTAGIFAGLIILCRQPLTYGRVMAAMAFGVVALLCKEQGILQPLIWFFLLSHLGIGGSTFKETRRRDSAKKDAKKKEENPVFFALLRLRVRMPAASAEPIEQLPQAAPGALKVFTLLTCWIWAGYIVGREHFLKFEWDRSFMDATIQPMVNSVGMDRILMPIVLLGRYTALLFWPAHLSPDYSADVIGSVAHLADPYFWLGIISLAAWLAATARAWFSARRAILFCLLSLAVAYGLIGNILTLIGTIFAERLLYLPSAFFLIIAGIVIAHLPIKPRLIAMTIILSLGSYRTFTAARLWNHPMELYRTALSNQPNSLQLRLLIAGEYHQAHNEPAAAAILSDACNIYPNSWRPWMYRANQAMDAGRLDDAQEYLNHAKRLEWNTNLLDRRRDSRK